MNTAQPATKPSDGAVAASIVLGIVIGLIWVLHLATVASLGRSDAAGNGIGQAYAAIQLIVLWLLLTIMTVIASAKGAAPKPATVAPLAFSVAHHHSGARSAAGRRLVLPCVVGLDAARGRRQGCRRRLAGSDLCRLRFDLAAVADAQD